MTQNPAAAYLDRRTRNLEFFSRNFPGIYNYFKDYRLQNLKLDIRPEDNEVDFIINNQHIYGGFGKRYASQEARLFNQHFPAGTRVRSVVPITRGEYTNPRFFAQRVKQLYAYSPLNLDSFEGYEVQDFLPMVVCLGVGLGLHIRELQEIRDVHHLVIVEHDPDRFAASLYTADWWRIVGKQREKPGRSIDFVLLHNVREWYDVRAALWNKLIERCPIFPVNTFMYNHRGDPRYDQVVNDINQDIYVHLFSFGNYDDELNQLNNAVHNFLRPVAKLGKAAALSLPDRARSGVCVVGSGPSLDQRIADLKTLASRSVVISCGTAIGALLKHGVIPDFHIELESDYMTYQVQSQNADLEALSKVRIVGAAQLCPRLFDLFGEKRLFFKAESPLSGLFGDPDERIVDAAPTCTNAALALAAHYRFGQVFLFGLDYGFPSASEHHARGTLYYEEAAHHAQVSQTLEDETIEIEAAAGGMIKSTTFLYTSKRRTENVLVSAARICRIFNFSDGARIERAEWVPSGGAERVLDSLDDVKATVVDALFQPEPVNLDQRLILQKVRGLESFVEDLAKRFRQQLREPIRDLAELTALCFRLNQYLQDKVLPDQPSHYYFVRGSIWHFLHAGYSHAFALPDGEGRRAWIGWWKDCFDRFLMDLPGHLHSVLDKDFGLPDPWIDRSIRELEPGAEKLPLPFRSTSWKGLGLRYTEKTGLVAEKDTRRSVPA